MLNGYDQYSRNTRTALRYQSRNGDDGERWNWKWDSGGVAYEREGPISDLAGDALEHT